MSQHEHLGYCRGRRQFLAAAASAPALAGMALAHVSAQEPRATDGKADANTKMGRARAFSRSGH